MGGRDGISALIVEGDLLGSLAISLHGTLRSGILWTVSRSCLVRRPIRPSGYRIPAFIRTCSYECGRKRRNRSNLSIRSLSPVLIFVSDATGWL